MKKLLLPGIFAALAFSMSAQTNTEPVGQWGNILDGKTTAGDQASGVAFGANGVSYWLNTMGSTEANPNIYLNDELLFEGEHYNSGNSQTNNFCLIAFDNNGAEKWLIKSTLGDYANNQGNVAVDADGNVIFTAKVRHGDFNDKQINIIDAEGTVTEFGGTPEQRSYNLLVAKASADGKLLWHQYITFSSVPGANATKEFIADAVKSTALAVDPQGNIYVGGNYSADMTVGGETIKAVNVENWSGDSQASSGNMFVLKFDADGKYISSATGTDGLSMSQVLTMEWNGTSLYVMGTATGAATATFGGKEFTPSDKVSLVFGKLNASLNADWLRCLPGSNVGTACVMQNCGISVVGNTLWFAGMFNGKFSDAIDSEKFIASAAQSPREGCIIKFNASTGEWLAGTTSRADEFPNKAVLTGYYKVIQSETNPAKCYVVGYAYNAAVGVFIREYNAITLEANLEHAWPVVTCMNNGMPSLVAVSYDSTTNAAYISARANKGFKLAGGVETVVPTTWAVLCSKFEMPAELNKPAAIDAVEAADTDAPAEYYNLQGIRVAEPQPGNLYILRQGNQTTKILF